MWTPLDDSVYHKEWKLVVIHWKKKNSERLSERKPGVMSSVLKSMDQ